jgi:hypothetical protein
LRQDATYLESAHGHVANNFNVLGISGKKRSLVSNLHCHCHERGLELAKQHMLEGQVGETWEQKMLWLAYQCGKQHSAV